MEYEQDPLDRRRGIAPVVYAVVAWTALVLLLLADVFRPDGGGDSGCLDICVGPPAWAVALWVLTPLAVFVALLARVTAASDERFFGDAVPRRVVRARYAADVALAVLTFVVVEIVFLH